MSRSRLYIVYALIAFLLGGNLLDAALRREHWPFSNYPMFATTAQSPLTGCQLTCLVNDPKGSPREMPLDWHCIPAMPPYKFDSQLRHLATGANPNPTKLRQMLLDYIAVYNLRCRKELFPGTPIVGLRLYQVQMPLTIPLEPATVDGVRPNHSQLLMEVMARP